VQGESRPELSISGPGKKMPFCKIILRETLPQVSVGPFFTGFEKKFAYSAGILAQDENYEYVTSQDNQMPELEDLAALSHGASCKSHNLLATD
jgi:hypothetical protein